MPFLGKTPGVSTLAAQPDITSLGTLTTLTVDSVAIDDTTIGHTSDTDLLTLTSGVLTVAGNIAVSGTVDGIDIAARDAVLTSTTTTADAALPKAGGAMTGAITTNSTFDGVDIAVRDAILTSTTTTAGAALPKAGGAMTGAITTNSTFDGRDVATDGTKLDGIEASADVTDTTNVTAAGALMDSELAGIAAIKATTGTFLTADQTKLDTIETSATADQTKSDIEGLGIDLPAANLTGTVAAARLDTATTTAESDDSTKIATTAYVTDKITTLIGGAPSTLNDLNELAAAINDDSNYNSTLTTALATKLPLAGGAMTGAITTNSTFDGRDVATDGTKLDGIAASANNYTHPNHSGDIVSTADGATVIQVDAVDIPMLSATGTASSTTFLRGDNSWVTPTDTNTTYSVGAGGLTEQNFTTTLKNKLDGIAASATANTGDITGVTAGTGMSGGGSSGAVTLTNAGVTSIVAGSNVSISGATGAVTVTATDTNTTYSVGDGGLTTNDFTNADHSKLNGIAASATNTAAPYYTSAISVGAGGLTQQNFTTTLKNKLDGIAASATNVTNNNQLSNGAGYTTNTGDITGVTAGTGMSGGGSSGTVTLNCSITNNNQLSNGAGYTTNTGTTTASNSQTFTNKTWSGALKPTTYQETYVDLGQNTTQTCNLANGNYFRAANYENSTTTYVFSNPPSSSTTFSFTLEIWMPPQTSAITWPSSVKWTGNTAPAAPGNSETAIYGFITRDGGTKWRGFLGGSQFA